MQGDVGLIPGWGGTPREGNGNPLEYFGWEILWTEEPATAAAKSLQLCPTLCDPIDGSTPGSPIPGIPKQEHWSGLPFPSPIHEKVKSESEVAQSCPTLSDPMDCSLPGSFGT